MKITIAKTACFCMGVRRAVEMVLDAPSKHREPIYTYGPLIHNPQVLDLLAEKGIEIMEDIPDSGSGTVLIRAHGVPPRAKQRLIRAGLDVIDATCPRVIKVQSIIKKHARQGYASIIVGDGDHPEVIGLLGYAGEKGYVVGSIQDLDRLPPLDRAIIVAQTTQSTRFFELVKQRVKRKGLPYKIFDTICDSTQRRQAEVKALAASADVDALVVVGGRNSSNTRRLVEIGEQTGKPTFHIETEADLKGLPLESARHIAITAGASTPNWIINRIFRTIEKIPLKKGRTWRKVLYVAQRALLLTNIYVALGAAGLCFACTRMLGVYPPGPYVLIAMAYVLSMHTLNNLLGTKADRYNDPGRAHFYRMNKVFLAFLAVAAGAYGLITASAMGRTPFLVLLLMSLLGLCYNVRLIPRGLGQGRYRTIRDLPGSKTVLIALAWGVVTSLFPALSESGSISLTAVLTFLGATGLVFVRSAFFDILDMQGDRIVGKDSIPLVYGEDVTLSFLNSILLGIVLTFTAGAALGILPTLAVALNVCPFFLYLTLSAHHQGHVLPGIRLEFLVESHFILAGAVALFWSALVL